jgi:hypothetical protein
MTQFATAAELAARLGITFTSAETTRANTLLALSSGLIQQETGQTISAVAADELECPSVSGSRFRLPERPVTSVTSVELDSELVGTDDYYLDGDELVRANFPVGSENHFGSGGVGWLGPLYTITVTYDHGYATVPELVKTVCMEAVARVWVNPGAATRETIGNASADYGVVGLLLAEHEKRALNDLLRRTAGTVTLR